jgi:hypothetical protein
VANHLTPFSQNSILSLLPSRGEILYPTVATHTAAHVRVETRPVLTTLAGFRISCFPSCPFRTTLVKPGEGEE